MTHHYLFPFPLPSPPPPAAQPDQRLQQRQPLPRPGLRHHRGCLLRGAGGLRAPLRARAHPRGARALDRRGAHRRPGRRRQEGGGARVSGRAAAAASAAALALRRQQQQQGGAPGHSPVGAPPLPVWLRGVRGFGVGSRTLAGVGGRWVMCGCVWVDPGWGGGGRC